MKKDSNMGTIITKRKLFAFLTLSLLNANSYANIIETPTCNTIESINKNKKIDQEVNWITQGLWKNNPQRFQGFVGSCHTFALTGLLEAYYKIAYNSYKEFSEAPLFWKHLITKNTLENMALQLKTTPDKYFYFQEGGNLQADLNYAKEIGVCEKNALSYTYEDIASSQGTLKNNYYTIRNQLNANTMSYDADVIKNDLQKNLKINLYNESELTRKNCTNQNKTFLNKLNITYLINHLKDKNLIKNILTQYLKYGPLGLGVKNYTTLKYGGSTVSSATETNFTAFHAVILAGITCDNKAIIRNSWGESDYVQIDLDRLIDSLFDTSILFHADLPSDQITENFLEKILDSIEEADENNIINIKELLAVPTISKSISTNKTVLKQIASKKEFFKTTQNIEGAIELTISQNDKIIAPIVFDSILKSLSVSKDLNTIETRQKIYYLVNKFSGELRNKKLLNSDEFKTFLNSWIKELTIENINSQYSYLNNLIIYADLDEGLTHSLLNLFSTLITWQVRHDAKVNGLILQTLDTFERKNIKLGSSPFMDQYIIKTVSNPDNFHMISKLMQYYSNPHEFYITSMPSKVKELDSPNIKTSDNAVSFLRSAFMRYYQSKEVISENILLVLDHNYQAIKKAKQTKKVENLIFILEKIFINSDHPLLSFFKAKAHSHKSYEQSDFLKMLRKVQNNKEFEKYIKEYETLVLSKWGNRYFESYIIENSIDFNDNSRAQIMELLSRNYYQTTNYQTQKSILKSMLKLDRKKLIEDSAYTYYKCLFSFLSDRSNTSTLTSPSEWILNNFDNRFSISKYNDLEYRKNQIKEPFYFFRKFRKAFVFYAK